MAAAFGEFHWNDRWQERAVQQRQAAPSGPPECGVHQIESHSLRAASKMALGGHTPGCAKRWLLQPSWVTRNPLYLMFELIKRVISPCLCVVHASWHVCGFKGRYGGGDVGYMSANYHYNIYFGWMSPVQQCLVALPSSALEAQRLHAEVLLDHVLRLEAIKFPFGSFLVPFLLASFEIRIDATKWYELWWGMMYG